ncbi:hypothetical protein H3Z83_02030 [Tenacibaculum sp. S7007]|uniref:Uncharacterized protein n=1 Tax=Tenacibaculum pelagium TaxID=2759527 RepID=A0A839ALE6_9FLAO|nr:hypothetical protein [Tenacibaculum pelagium]MBA6155307.1 hypothetical protein [Tenacibaculum pelagium]
MKTITNKFKIALVAVGLLAVGTVNAQTTGTDITKQAPTVLGSSTTATAATPGASAIVAPTSGATVQGGSVRVIDNKGTMKYLQVQNGLTQMTNTAPDGGITTTWQLGGQIVSDTDIDFNGNVFSFNNVVQIDGTDAVNGIAATTTTTASGQGNTGWTLLVRDEGTGEIKKLLASDLVVSGQTYFTAAVADAVAGATAAELTFDVTAGTPALAGAQLPLPDYSKVWVYRNGAKLIANLDYTIVGSTVVLAENATAPSDWSLFSGDIIEVQYVK